MQFSVINKQNLEGAFRIDPEYYQPKYLQIESLINRTGYKLLGSLALKVTDFGAYSQNNIIEYKSKGYAAFIRNQDVSDLLVRDEERIFIEKEVYDKLSLHLDEKDVLVQRVGSLGRSSIVLKKDLPATANQNLAQIKIDTEKLNPFFLITYLNCKFGLSYFERLQTGNVQPWLNLQQITNLKIPVFSPELQILIESLVQESFRCVEVSKLKYKKAQDTLLSELGLSNWQPEHQRSFIKNYSEADKAGRIDAEYFQPKYDEIVNAIKSYSGGYSIVSKEFKQNKSVLKPDAAQTYQYVEIGSINVATGEISASDVVGAELPDNAKRVLRKDDVIVSKVRTYRGAMAIVDQDGLIGSGAFTALHVNGQINKETLLTFLRSKPLLVWSLKPNTGTSYPVILDEDILNLPIPLFSEETQLKVKQKVTESFNLRKQSKRLLECAKKAVEIAIEGNEDAAIKWLKEQTKANGGKAD